MIRQFLTIDQCSFVGFIQVEISHLGYDEKQTKLGSNLRDDREVANSVRSHLDVSGDPELVLTRRWVSNLHDVQSLHSFSGFLFTKGEKTVLESGVSICDR